MRSVQQITILASEPQPLQQMNAGDHFIASNFKSGRQYGFPEGTRANVGSSVVHMGSTNNNSTQPSLSLHLYSPYASYSQIIHTRFDLP